MGTRAQFFIGDPRDTENRVWLGTIGWDGYPDGDCEALRAAQSESNFRSLVELLAADRRDFCDPVAKDFPFPWTDDLFLTDCTYAWFDGAVQFTWFHRGFVPLEAYLGGEDAFLEAYHEGAEQLASNVPAPQRSGKPLGPDSIMILSVAPSS